MTDDNTHLISCVRYLDGSWSVCRMHAGVTWRIAAGHKETSPKWFTDIWTVAQIGGYLSKLDPDLVWCYVTPEFELIRFYPKELI